MHPSPASAFRLFTARPALTLLLSALLWALCYPPFPLAALAFVVLAPAFVATTRLTPKRAFRLWFVAGMAYNTAMYWWIWNVIKVGPVLAIGLGLVVLILFLSLFNGALGWGFARAWHASPGRRPVLLATYPLAWGGLEAARAVGEMSFPWNNLAYTLGNHPAWFQSVSVWGSYGLSAAMVATNLLIACGLTGSRLRRARPAAPWAALAALAIPLLLLLHGTVRLSRTDDAAAPRLDISLVQPSIPQTRKWNEDYFGEVVRKTFRVMEGPEADLAPVRGSDMVVLAETAIPDFFRSRATLVDSLEALASGLNAQLLVGALDVIVDRTPWSDFRYYNSAFLFDPARPGTMQQYSKLRLVPFSEKLPFDGIFPVLNYVNLGEGDFSPGDGLRTWGPPETRWAPSICYEIIYPSFAREAREAGAKLLVNITNDGWFGRSNGPYQHANISRFRAAETGMTVARCANSGVSVFFDAYGRDLGRSALMDSVVLRRTVSIPDVQTPYARFGGLVDTSFLAFLPAWILLVVFSRPRSPRHGRSTLTT